MRDHIRQNLSEATSERVPLLRRHKQHNDSHVTPSAPPPSCSRNLQQQISAGTFERVECESSPQPTSTGQSAHGMLALWAAWTRKLSCSTAIPHSVQFISSMFMHLLSSTRKGWLNRRLRNLIQILIYESFRIFAKRELSRAAQV